MIASLCVLAYKRPELLIKCLDTLHETIDFPCEIIVNVDGEDNPDQHAASIAHSYYRKKLISKLITVGGSNRGVGRSFQNCLGVAEGDYIFKIDADITFKPNWLSKAIGVLDNNPDVGSVGLFDYHRQDPNDERFKPENNVIEKRSDCLIVEDFVSSIYGFRNGPYGAVKMPDDGWHQSVAAGKKMALADLVDVKAFGFGSVYVTLKPDGTATKTQTFEDPLIFTP